MFVRHDAVKRPLQQPYDGPYLVLDRSDRFYTLDLNGHTDTVSIDRLKPAYRLSAHARVHISHSTVIYNAHSQSHPTLSRTF